MFRNRHKCYQLRDRLGLKGPKTDFFSGNIAGFIRRKINVRFFSCKDLKNLLVDCVAFKCSKLAFRKARKTRRKSTWNGRRRTARHTGSFNEIVFKN
jgi:hypothetical protein